MSDFYRVSVRKSKRERKCDWISCSINAGDQYLYTFGRVDGRMYRLGYCLSCAQAVSPVLLDEARTQATQRKLRRDQVRAVPDTRNPAPVTGPEVLNV